MSNIVLCPNCGGQKKISKPPYIAGDVNAWVSSGTSTYPCPTCEGRGWIRVDSVPQDKFDCIKSVALSSMETAETLMGECAKRADRIKELETSLKRTEAGELAADKEIERLRSKMFDIEGREDLVTTELEHQIELRDAKIEKLQDGDYSHSPIEIVSRRDERIEELLETINDLTSENKRLEDGIESSVSNKDMETLVDITWTSCSTLIHSKYSEYIKTLESCTENMLSEYEHDKIDLELLDDILEIVNPLIKNGAYAKPAAESRLLATRMYGLCQTVVLFRRKHNIVG